MVVECIDGENLLSLDSRQSEDSRNVIIPVFELRLVEQDFHITVINDSLLDNGRINHIVQFLCHYSGDAVELTHRLIQIFDVLSHRRGGDGFPCLFDDESLSAFLDTHFLKEHIHDDEHDDREQHGVVLDFVNLEEPLIKERLFQVVVQRTLQFTTAVELFENGGEVINVEGYLLLGHQLRNTFQRIFIESVEGQLFDGHLPSALLHLLYLLFDAHEVAALDYLCHETHELTVSRYLLTLRRCLVIDQGMQFFHLTFCLDLMLYLGFREDIVATLRIYLCRNGFLMFSKILVVMVFHLLAILLILTVLLILQQKPVAQPVLFFRRETTERVEKGIIVLHDNLIDNGILNF